MAHGFFIMMTKIGAALQAKAKIIPPLCKTINLTVLDLCMAPGGYSATALKFNPHAKVCGISLPEELGGHEVYLPNWKDDRRVKIRFEDITMLAAEFGYPDLVSQNDGENCQFSTERPFQGQSFDVVFCDGKVLDSHTRTLESTNEPARLSAAQLMLALQRIKYGGTLVMLLHQAYSPTSVRLLEAFDQFSTVHLIKHNVSHVKRTSFYLVAKNVDPAHDRAKRLVEQMRSSWRLHTALSFGVSFPGEELNDDFYEDSMESIMESFGEKLIELAEPAWRLQTRAMEREFLME